MLNQNSNLIETRQERIARQAKQHRKWIKEIEWEVAKSYQMKVLHDAYYSKVDFKEEVILMN